MKKVQNGLFVSVDYKGTLENGEVFDTSHGRQPLEVQIGQGQVIKGFEEELLGMTLNQKKVFTLEPQDAYGSKNEKLVHTLDKSDFPQEMDLEIGLMVGLHSPEGQPIPARIVGLEDETVTLDLNHPLAGEPLTFEIEVVGISETRTQKPAGCGCNCDCSSGEC